MGDQALWQSNTSSAVTMPVKSDPGMRETFAMIYNPIQGCPNGNGYLVPPPGAYRQPVRPEWAERHVHGRLSSGSDVLET